MVCPDADGVGGEIGGSVERPGVEGSGVGRGDGRVRATKSGYRCRGKSRSIKRIIKKKGMRGGAGV
jgi:outer membrane lipoprotein SlyB